MRTCARCGADCSSAASETRRGVTAFYCDDPAAAAATCYHLSKWAGFPELLLFL